MYYVVVLLLLFVTSLCQGQALDRAHLNYYNPLEYGANCDDTTLNTTISQIGSARATLYFTKTNRAKVACTWNITSNVGIPSNITVYIPAGVAVNVFSGYTLTVAGPLHIDDVSSLQGAGSHSFSYNNEKGLSSYISSGCAPTVPVSSMTLGAFSCTGTLVVGANPFSVQQDSSALALTGTDGTYWLALDYSSTRSVAGWSRYSSTKYLWQKSTGVPIEASGTKLFAKITVAGSIITAIADIRTPQSYALRKVIDITDPLYGAIGDGSTSATVAIQSATNAANALASLYGHSVTVQIPSGVFNVTAPTQQSGTTYYALIPRSNVHYVGPGTLRLADNQTVGGTRNPNIFYLINAPLDNVWFEGITFNMNGANNTIPLAGIWANSVFQAIGENNASGDNMVVTNFRFINNYVYDHKGSNTLLILQSHAAAPLSSDIVIEGNTFYRVGLATDDHSTINTFANNVQVLNNRFINDDSDANPIHVACPYESHGSNSLFQGNIVKNFYKGYIASINFTSDSLNNSINNNTFENIGYSGVEINTAGSTGGYTIRDVTINGNNLVWNEEACTCANTPVRFGVNFVLDITTATVVRNVIVSNNNFERKTLVSNTIRNIGIGNAIGSTQTHFDTAFIDAVQIIGNTFHGASIGVDLTSTDTTRLNWMRNTVISGNIFRNSFDIGGGAGYGIVIQGDDSPAAKPNVTIQGNKFVDDQAGSPVGTGILLSDRAGHFVVQNNDYANILNPITATFTNVTEYTVREYTPQYKTFNSGITASIASGTAVNHGMGCASGYRIILQPADGTPTAYFPNTIGGTTFTINFTGGGSHAFYWTGSCYEH